MSLKDWIWDWKIARWYMIPVAIVWVLTVLAILYESVKP